jgi:fructose-1,6-bisphosphatase II / sedoheptulose-1,7-bisphosphatase
MNQDGREGMATVTVAPNQMLERILSIEIVRVTERAAVSAARLRGHGKDKASDQAAVGGDRRRRTRRSSDAVHR